jgi:large subunit ribosomal protein L32
MALPTQGHTKAHRNKRRSHDALKKKTLGKCAECGAVVIPHHACKKCGTYRGRKVTKK